LRPHAGAGQDGGERQNDGERESSSKPTFHRVLILVGSASVLS
jgi:hypothetical protein